MQIETINALIDIQFEILRINSLIKFADQENSQEVTESCINDIKGRLTAMQSALKKLKL